MHLMVKWNPTPLDYYTKSFSRQCVRDWIKLVRSSVAYLHFFLQVIDELLLDFSTMKLNLRGNDT